MRIFWLLCLFISWLPSIGQVTHVSGVVYDSESREPLPFAAVTVNGTRSGTSTDIDGFFKVSADNIHQLTFSYVGYERFSMPITSETPMPLEVYMQPSVTNLQEVTVVAGENPAWELIRKVVANRDRNNPEHLQSFSYTTYNKLFVTLDFDSAGADIDTIRRNVVTENGLDSSFTIVDSSVYEARRMMERSHLFMLESVSERKFKAPGKNNEEVLATRVSGFKNPMFTLLATQLQSFSFYGDHIIILQQKYLNPINPGFEKRYMFNMKDTLVEGKDTTFVISYAPVPNPSHPSMRGLLYVTTDGWALTNVVAEPAEESGLTVRIQQKYEKKGGVYFPVQHNYDFLFGNVSFNGVMPVGIGRTYLRDIEIDPKLENRDFYPVEVRLDPQAADRDPEFWEKYRGRPMDSKETRTYEFIDSIGEEENLERKLDFLLALRTGKLRVGFVDLDLDRFLKYNVYEGVRLGAGLHTNSRLLPWLTIGGFAGWGTSDNLWKYGYDGAITLSQKYQLKIGGGYRFDLFETGGMSFDSKRELKLINTESYRNLWVEQYDEVSEAYGYIEYHPLPKIHTRFGFSRQNRWTLGPYQYLMRDKGENGVLQNGFTASFVNVEVQYAPGDKYMEGPFGRRPISQTYPVFTAKYQRGIDGLLDSEFSFDRVDLRIDHSLLWRHIGTTTFRLEGGMVMGGAPASWLYFGNGSKPVNYYTGDFLITTYWGFETMRMNEFLSDRFASLTIRHNFGQYLFKTSDKSAFHIVGRGYFGQLEDPDVHRNIRFMTPDKGYFEAGFELDNFIPFQMLDFIGIGGYYRLGAYQFDDPWKNLAIKMTVKTSL
ncbi:MAG: DUF5686 and carboxypeptidase regulatory-like domain-containing protein [Bacteroidota bacterium]|nr:DUF5686 and carboxypeptidase regulatory-like domain-containing protein [Bacteroidota bacterium]MDX5505538.1 DUF5686 and carboxypeptidase regulatory-like domain-containing protein [Bacteroidota bacterium]